MMTTKEVLYVEDVLGHETCFDAQCRETISRLQDPELRQCVQELGKKHTEIFSSFYGLL